MREIQFTNPKVEHTFGILADLNLPALGEALAAKSKDEGLVKIFSVVGELREKRVFRRLEAVWSASDIELDAAEKDAAQMEALIRKHQDKPFLETLEGLAAFFAGPGLLLSATLASFVRTATETTETPKTNEEGTIEATAIEPGSPSET